MADFRKVTDRLSVSPQITAEEARTAAQQGFALIIDNRPDGEAPGQPTAQAVEAAARAAGADFLYLPIMGRPTDEQARRQQQAVAQASGPVLAYCRSGTRSITAWALGEAQGGASRDELIRLGAEAGYDLGPILPG